METTLNNLKLNQAGIIKNIDCAEHIKTRLLDLGVITGTTVTPKFKSFLNDPTAFEVCGSILAIREEDSKHITISYDI